MLQCTLTFPPPLVALLSTRLTHSTHYFMLVGCCCKNYKLLSRSARQFELKWEYYRASYRQLWSLKLSGSQLEGAVHRCSTEQSATCPLVFRVHWLALNVQHLMGKSCELLPLCCNVAITRFECRLLHTR